jgi:hypothetical protein
MEERERREARVWTIVGSAVVVFSIAGLMLLWFGVL